LVATKSDTKSDKIEATELRMPSSSMWGLAISGGLGKGLFVKPNVGVEPTTEAGFVSPD
jgi:hypothetical protein